MPQHSTLPAETPVAEAEAAQAPVAEPNREPELVVEDLLVEDVSIDGMCGVY